MSRRDFYLTHKHDIEEELSSPLDTHNIYVYISCSKLYYGFSIYISTLCLLWYFQFWFGLFITGNGERILYLVKVLFYIMLSMF